MRESSDEDNYFSKDEPCSQEEPEVTSEDHQDKERSHSHSRYDSSSEYDTDLDEDECKWKTECAAKRKLSELENEGIGHVTYEVTCRSLGTVPIRKVAEQLHVREMKLQHVGLNKNHCKALACALWENTCLESLDLHDNGLEGEDLVPIIDVLRTSTNISQLTVSDNKIDIVAVMVIDEVLQETEALNQLNLSGTGIGDRHIEYLATGIQHNTSLMWLDLSHNNIGIEGAKKLGRALGDVEYLQFVDLSWNHIRMSGAVALLKGIKLNKSMCHLNLSMNGLGYEGSLALEETLKENKGLRVLDVSNNRINWEGVVYIARGLRRNSTLRMLNIGDNPLNMEGCCVLMKAVSSRWCKLEHVGLENVPVNGAVLCMVQEVLKSRPFSLIHGGVLDTTDVIGIRKEKPEDPITLVVRYLAMTGIRIIDMFRMFDVDNDGEVSKAEFVKGMKKIGIPLRDSALRAVASRLDKQNRNIISYSLLVHGVRNHLRAERQDSRREEIKEKRKVQQQRQILQTSLPPIFKRNYEEEMMSMYSARSNANMNLARSNASLGSTPRLSITSQQSYNISGSAADLRDQIQEEDGQHAHLLPGSRETHNQLSMTGTPGTSPRSERKRTDKWLDYIHMLIERRKQQAEFFSSHDRSRRRSRLDRMDSRDTLKSKGSGDTDMSINSKRRTSNRSRLSLNKDVHVPPICIGGRLTRSSERLLEPSDYVQTQMSRNNRRRSVAGFDSSCRGGRDKYNNYCNPSKNCSLLPRIPSDKD